MDRTPRVSLSMRGTVGIISMTGDLTDSVDSILLQFHKEALSKGAKHLLLKIHPKSFINSAGIRSILSLVFAAEAVKQSVGVVGLSPHMNQIFDLVGLHQYLKVYSSEPETLKDWK